MLGAELQKALFELEMARRVSKEVTIHATDEKTNQKSLTEESKIDESVNYHET